MKVGLDVKRSHAALLALRGIPKFRRNEELHAGGFGGLRERVLDRQGGLAESRDDDVSPLKGRDEGRRRVIVDSQVVSAGGYDGAGALEIISQMVVTMIGKIILPSE